jgi:hypothetical protein
MLNKWNTQELITEAARTLPHHRVRILLTNHVLCQFCPTDFKKFPASLVPARHPMPVPTQLQAPSNSGKDSNDLDGDDSGVETEREWFEESQLTEVAQRFSSKTSAAMATKVRLFFFFSLRLIHVFIEASVVGFVGSCFHKCNPCCPVLLC